MEAQAQQFERAGELGNEEYRLQCGWEKIEAREQELFERERKLEAADNRIRVKYEEIETRERQLDQGWRNVERLANYHKAFEARLAEISQGQIRTAGDIDLHPSLTPAQSGLAMIVDIIAKRTIDIRRSVTEKFKSLDERERKLKEAESVIERRETEATQKIRASALLKPVLQQLFDMLSEFKFRDANVDVVDRARSTYSSQQKVR